MTCKTHPDAPHGFVRDASHSEDRYVCECEFWEEPKMNEKIKLLAEQAGLKQRIWNSLGKELPMWQEDPNNPGLAKFAELIVRECMNALAESREVRQTAYYYRNRIAKHFGVEE
jgi:hypothetical protein